jgi:hypothetical protein
MIKSDREKSPAAINPAATDTSPNSKSRSIACLVGGQDELELAEEVLASHSHTATIAGRAESITDRERRAPARPCA